MFRGSEFESELQLGLFPLIINDTFFWWSRGVCSVQRDKSPLLYWFLVTGIYWLGRLHLIES